jgi:hypothetical protein
MSAARRIHSRETQPNGPTAKVSRLIMGLLVATAAMLAIRVYFVTELLVVWAAFVVMFSAVTGSLILLVLIQECGRWSVRKFKKSRAGRVLLLGDANNT